MEKIWEKTFFVGRESEETDGFRSIKVEVIE